MDPQRPASLLPLSLIPLSLLPLLAPYGFNNPRALFQYCTSRSALRVINRRVESYVQLEWLARTDMLFEGLIKAISDGNVNGMYASLRSLANKRKYIYIYIYSRSTAHGGHTPEHIKYVRKV